MAHAIQNILRQLGYVTEAERRNQEEPAATRADPASPRFVAEIRRPVLMSRDRTAALFPKVIPVPGHVQSAVGARGSAQTVYRILVASAKTFYRGSAPSSITGGGTLREAATFSGGWYAQWMLSLLLQYAPDDNARSNALAALWELPSFPLVAGSPYWGPSHLIQPLLDSGVVSAYASAFAVQTPTRAVLQAVVKDKGTQDPTLLHALALTPAMLPPQGWASRCVSALWNGSMPSELGYIHLADGKHLDGPSTWLVLSAAQEAPTSLTCNGLVNAMLTVPGVETNRPLHRFFAAALSTKPREYGPLLAHKPLLCEIFADALRHGRHDPWATPDVCAFIGVPTPR
jgi:hypothetical protein